MGLLLLQQIDFYNGPVTVPHKEDKNDTFRNGNQGSLHSKENI